MWQGTRTVPLPPSIHTYELSPRTFVVVALCLFLIVVVAKINVVNRRLNQRVELRRNRLFLGRKAGGL